MKTPAIVVLCLLGALMTDATRFCHYKTPMEDFSMTKFMGKWWWTMETPNVYSGRGDRCPVTEMHVRDNGTMAYILKYIYTGRNHYTTKEGNMWHCSSNPNDAKLVVAMPTQYGYWEARWWILDTDYDNYAASYACWFASDGSFRGWSMGWCREKVCSEEHREAIKRAFLRHEIDVNALEDLSTRNCPDP